MATLRAFCKTTEGLTDALCLSQGYIHKCQEFKQVIGFLVMCNETSSSLAVGARRNVLKVLGIWFCLNAS